MGESAENRLQVAIQNRLIPDEVLEPHQAPPVGEGCGADEWSQLGKLLRYSLNPTHHVATPISPPRMLSIA